MMRPLEGLLVLDFSPLLPGPMASLMLAEAGARVVKIERPGRGDEMRSYEPKLGEDSVNIVMLNRGKQSIATDPKAPDRSAERSVGQEWVRTVRSGRVQFYSKNKSV